MNPPDFEISVSLRAEKLVSRVPPDAQTETLGEEVTLERRQTRHGPSARLEPADHCDDVAVEKQIVGRIAVNRAASENGPSARG